METALTTIIVGVGVLAIVELLANGTNTNIQSADLTTGVNLAKNIRELSLKLAFLDPNTPTNWGLDAGESANNPATAGKVPVGAPAGTKPSTNTSRPAVMTGCW